MLGIAWVQHPTSQVWHAFAWPPAPHSFCAAMRWRPGSPAFLEPGEGRICMHCRARLRRPPSARPVQSRRERVAAFIDALRQDIDATIPAAVRSWPQARGFVQPEECRLAALLLAWETGGMLTGADVRDLLHSRQDLLDGWRTATRVYTQQHTRGRGHG